MKKAFGFCALLAHVLAYPALAEERLALTFPVACVVGDTCVIQNYVDHDASAVWRDFACGAMSYDGHDGTDIRIPTLEAQRRGVGVLAAAEGTVLRTRTDMPDKPLTDDGLDDDPRACGNGLVIDHGKGWETQYCHMAQGSLLVRTGDRVKAGQRLGLIGVSGRTSFPHLHLTVRHEGQVVDPFAPELALDACGTATGKGLFDTPGRTVPYLDRFILNTGFADGPVSVSDIENGQLDARKPKPQSDALVVYMRAIGLQAGDALSMVLVDPDGAVVVQKVFDPLERSKAQLMQYIGRKRPETGWKAGTYGAVLSILREGKRLAEKRIFIAL